MAALLFTNKARQDLLDIWRYIAVQNPIIADKVFDRLENACQPLRHSPHLGRLRPEIGENVRCLVIDRWLVLYRVIKVGVEIVRIVDGARDLTQFDWRAD